MAHGLVSLQDGDENICKKDEKKDASSKDVKGYEDLEKEEDNVGSNASDFPVQPDSLLLVDTSIAGKMGKIKEEVALIISEGKEEEYSEAKLKTLKTILSLLEVDKEKEEIQKKRRWRKKYIK